MSLWYFPESNDVTLGLKGPILSSIPHTGASARSVLTAHTGLAKATLFNNLKDIELEGTFSVPVFGDVLTYRVLETQTILPHETGSLIIQNDRDIVTLVTCTCLRKEKDD